MKMTVFRASARAIAAALALAAVLPAHADGFWSKSYRPDRDLLIDLPYAEKRFNDARTKAAGDPAMIADYVQAGITISDISCDAWLAVLGRSDRDTTLFKDVLNIVGNLIIGVAGINGASSTSLARGALGLSASNASVDAFRNEILLGAMTEIEKKMKEGRRVSAAFFIQNIPSHFDEAARKMVEYHDTCTPGEIRLLLKTSLAQVKYVAPDTSLAGPIDSANADILAAALYSMMFKPGDPGAVGSLSADSVYGLWVSVIGAPGDSTSNVVTNIKESANVVSLKRQFEEKNKNGELAPTLQRIADLRGYAKRLDDQLAKEKADKAKVEAAAAVEKKEKEFADASDEAEKATKESAAEAGKAGKPASEKAAAERIFQNFSASRFSLAGPRISLSDAQIQGLENMTREAQVVEDTAPSPPATDAKLKLKAVAEKARELEAARARLRNLPNALSSRSSPPSISAIIVPVR